MQQVSQRKYAATIGVSHWAVGKAIKAGHIKKGLDKRTKKINVLLANKEWGNAVRERQKINPPHSEKENSLKAAFVNYCNAYASLVNEIEKHLTKIEQTKDET
jgi:hypothetical protein